MDRIVVLALIALAFPYAWASNVTGSGAPIPDSIQEDLDHGRFWKASLALRAHLGPVEESGFDDRLLLARAEVGWRNWRGAVQALTAGEPDEAGAPPEYWFALGKALQETGEYAGGEAALARFVELAPTESPEALVARSRIIGGRSWESSELEGALRELRSLSPVLADWTALAAARRQSEAGEATSVPHTLDRIVDPSARARGWDLEVEAWLHAGDTARAVQVLAELEPADEGSPSKLEILHPLWRYRLALGDTAGSVAAIVEVLSETTRGQAAVEAAKAFLAMGGGSDAETLLRTASTLAGGGEYGPALRVWALAASSGAVLTTEERLLRARALRSAGQPQQAVAEYRSLAESSRPEVAAPALQGWAAVRKRQGRPSDARIVEDRLVERFPTRPEALDVVFFRGDDHQDAGRLARAVEQYRKVVAMVSSADRAGLARMRWAQIHLSRGEHAEALDVFEAYLDEFPTGRRWEEASYWGAWSADRIGDRARAQALIRRLQAENPLSYYSVLAAELDDHPMEWTFPDGPVLPDPTWLQRELEVLRLLEDAGLGEGAGAHVSSLKTAAWSSDGLLMRLALELNEGGRTMDGINLGWELRRRGREWDRTLLSVVYPFPYRDLVVSVAADLDLDPYLLAAMIRQESAFVPDIVSRAGAVGLMQVMPATGRQIARAVGPRGFEIEVLRVPDVNVHLGTRMLADLLHRYGADLPLVLSAYNAGPGRADRWRRFPEVDDPRRFTERIPFAETRGYVKNVTRNRAVYRWLYGSSTVSAADLGSRPEGP